MYTWDKERRRVIDPYGNALTVKELLAHLNNMATALTGCVGAWEIFGNGLSLMDEVFLGSTITQETYEPDTEATEDTTKEEVV